MAAQGLGVRQADARDAQTVDHPGQRGVGGFGHRCHQIVVGLLPKALHFHDGLLMAVQVENIRILVDKSGPDKFFQGGLAEAVDI